MKWLILATLTCGEIELMSWALFYQLYFYVVYMSCESSVNLHSSVDPCSRTVSQQGIACLVQ